MLKINIEKAKEIKKGIIRQERKPMLEALDLEVMKNITNQTELERIEAEKQKLRDIPLKVEELKTIEELKNATIDTLLEI